VALALLLGQGRIGLAPPHGDGGTLAQVLPEYLARPQRTLVGWLLVAAMAGWLAFNVGLGGAALAALTGTAPAIGVAAFGLPLLLLALAGCRGGTPSPSSPPRARSSSWSRSPSWPRATRRSRSR